MYVKAMVNFHDNLKDVDRKVGEQFTVSRERYEEINAIGMEKIGAPIVSAVQENPQTPESRAKKASVKRRTKKASSANGE